MSYLPRMSKTYKEPRVAPQEDSEENSLTYNTLQPASSLLNEKTYNPQMVLKHYRYLPHPPPVLPGPSVLEEAMENEMYREAVKQRRSSEGKFQKLSETTQPPLDLPTTPDSSKATIIEEKIPDEFSNHPKRSRSKKGIKGSRGSVGRKKSSRNSLERKKENISKSSDVTINMCLVGSSVSQFASAQIENKYRENNDDNYTFLNRNELSSLKSEKSDISKISILTFEKSQKLKTLPKHLETRVSENKQKEFTHRSIQCTIFGSAEKIFVIPLVLHSLLRALAFLLHELNREETINCSSKEIKRLMTQIQLILGDLCSQKIEKNFGFDTTYSDSKRVEKIMEDLKRYVTDLYGEKGDTINKFENVKKVFVDMKKKEIEFLHLNEKLQENLFEKEEFKFNENDFKYPEITLQNKKLESEQLLAEIEFSRRELKKCQNNLAEIDWDIKTNNEEVASFKKSLASKSEKVAKKTSLHKFSTEMKIRSHKSKENKDSDSIKKNNVIL